VSRKVIVAAPASRTALLCNCCRPKFTSPRFVEPRKIVNAPELVAELGMKFTFTVRSTWSVSVIGVTVTSRPMVTHAAEMMVSVSVAVAVLALSPGTAMTEITERSRFDCTKSKLPSVVTAFAPRTEYVYVPAAPGVSM
jgi:hypothetical protein